MSGAADRLAKRGKTWGVRASTVLLLLALLGVVLRAGGVAGTLVKLWLPLGLVLTVLGPVWAASGFLAATVYLMLSTQRPYSALQHLLEMVAGAGLILLMAPVS